MLSPHASYAQESSEQLPVVDAHLGTVLVQGKQPGPRLWKVTYGENTLWIVGTLSPLPTGMQWDSTRVERLVAASQQVIWKPSLSVGADVGVFKGAYFAFPLKRSEGNPDGKMLKDVLPADTYAQWLTHKQRYLGNNRSIESKRPMFAAGKLYEAALKRSRLSGGSVVEAPILKVVTSNKIPLNSPT